MSADSPKRTAGRSEARHLGALAAVVVSVCATLYALATFASAVSWVEHTHETKEATAEWFASMLDAESAERGYVLSGKREFLDPYQRALADLPTTAARLRSLTADNAGQLSRIGVAETRAVACATGMRETVALMDEGDREAAIQRVAGGLGKERLDAFRAAVGAIEVEEERLLLERTRSERVRGVLSLIAVGTFSGVAVYLMFAAWSARRDAELAERAAASAQAVAELEQAASAERARLQSFQETFIAVLGHDLRNPLNSISMAHQLVLRRKDLPPEVVTPLRRASAACARMNRMIAQIVDFTRSRLAGGLPLVPGEMDLGALLREVVGESRMANPGRAIDVQTEGDLHGSWDNDRLAQVVSNLVGNAIVHGVGEAPVRVSARARPESVEVQVMNGGEIPSEVRDSLFDPFRRASTQTKSAGASGLGLGLFITDQIVRQHGGSLVATSREGTTSFVFQLPRVAAGAASGEPVARGESR